MFDFNATFIVAIISFVIFIMIMNTIFYKPILNIIRKREDYINSNYEQSKAFDKSAEEYRQTHAKKYEEKQDECRQKFKFAISKVQADASKEIFEARENAKQEILQRKNQLSQDSEKLKRELEDSVLDELATSITSKLVKNIMD